MGTPRISPLLLGATVTALLVSACASGPNVDSVARDRASREFACPAAVVVLRHITYETVRVEACGHVTTYTCPAAMVDRRGDWDRSCIREAPAER